MSGLVRVTITIESDLLEEIDRLCKDRRFASRSDGFRQLFRETLTASAWQMGAGEAIATLTLVCHYSCAYLGERLMALQRAHNDLVVSTTQVHLDCDTSLEVIILKGSHARLKALTPNSKQLYDCVSYNPLRPGWKAPRSQHPGGVNVMFSDGHVQFIKETINTVTWTALGTRNGGEVISADSF